MNHNQHVINYIEHYFLTFDAPEVEDKELTLELIKEYEEYEERTRTNKCTRCGKEKIYGSCSKCQLEASLGSSLRREFDDKDEPSIYD